MYVLEMVGHEVANNECTSNVCRAYLPVPKSFVFYGFLTSTSAVFCKRRQTDNRIESYRLYEILVWGRGPEADPAHLLGRLFVVPPAADEETRYTYPQNIACLRRALRGFLASGQSSASGGRTHATISRSQFPICTFLLAVLAAPLPQQYSRYNPSNTSQSEP